MKKSRQLRDMLIGSIITVLVLGFPVIGMAGSNSRTVQAIYDNIKLLVNGQNATAKDGNGTLLEPVLIDGITYVPVRSISDSLNMDLTWDNTTKTAKLNSKAGVLPGTILPDESGYIGVEKAKSIALKHANIAASNTTFFKAELDWDDGRAKYEVEFYSGNMEYDYEIDPKSGSILSWDHEVEGYKIPGQDNSNTGKEKVAITLEQAKALAKAKAPNATLVSCQLDQEDGKAIYEGELRDGETEYEFEIDAASGQFIKWDVDVND